MMKKQVDIETEKKSNTGTITCTGYHSVAFEDCDYYFCNHSYFYIPVWNCKNQ